MSITILFILQNYEKNRRGFYKRQNSCQLMLFCDNGFKRKNSADISTEFFIFKISLFVR